MDYSLIDFYAPYNTPLPSSTMKDISSYNNTPTSELGTVQWHDDLRGDNIATYDYAMPFGGPPNLNALQQPYISDATHLDWAKNNPYVTGNGIPDLTHCSIPDQVNRGFTSLGSFVNEAQPSVHSPTDADIILSGFQQPNANLSGTIDFSASVQYPVSRTSTGPHEGNYVNCGGYISAPTIHTADWSVNGNYWTRYGTTHPAHADTFGENASFSSRPADIGAQNLWNGATSNPDQNLYFNGATANGAPNPGTMYAPAQFVDPFVPPLPAVPPSTDAAHSGLGTESDTRGFGFSRGLSRTAVNGRKVLQSLTNEKRDASFAYNEASETNLWTPASDSIGPTMEMREQQMAIISLPEPDWDEIHNSCGSKATEIQGTTSPEGPSQAAAGRNLMADEQYDETLLRRNNTYKIGAPGEYNNQGWSNLETMSSVGEGSSLLPGTCPSDARHGDDVHGDDGKTKSKAQKTKKRARKENKQPGTEQQPKKKQKREKIVFCLKCKEGFTTLRDFARHEKHVENGEKIVCEYCHRSYSRDTPRHLQTKVCQAARAALAQSVQEEKERAMLEQSWIDTEGF
ncbi:hypothetical protein EW146_g3106 [Bondarzewia mesenterica]|uniref:C2H2-type domain-containing protein n=1 Tax=Bondarzewia mesenterica TaxID=1095465 RepID=A0A4S4LZ37_9AGAM|nr:hypothetical protein EW146_g3106 [Bondarzewia mesenterica]